MNWASWIINLAVSSSLNFLEMINLMRFHIFMVINIIIEIITKVLLFWIFQEGRN